MEVQTVLQQLVLVAVKRTALGTFQWAFIAKTQNFVLSELVRKTFETTPDFFVLARVVHLRTEGHQSVVERIGQFAFADGTAGEFLGAVLAETVAGLALVNSRSHGFRADRALEQT